MGWLKLYYRDNKKVMRAIEGMRILVVPGSEPTMVYLAESVYTPPRSGGRSHGMYWFDHVDRQRELIE